VASTGKRKTTMAKLNRERKLREKRAEKKLKKDIRRREAAEAGDQPAEAPAAEAPAGDDL